MSQALGNPGATETGARCPFCNPARERLIKRGTFASLVRDAYPVSPGHTLAIPHRHIGSFFELNAEERGELFALLEDAKRDLDRSMSPAGYNIGINDGVAAGQTIRHVHIHLIPRYAGDQPDPRGGIRWIFPDRARYW
ncbi:MAG: HIT family protein [Burkholderiales bacterium]